MRNRYNPVFNVMSCSLCLSAACKRQFLRGTEYFDILVLLKIMLTFNVPVKMLNLAPKKLILFYCSQEVKCRIV